MMKRSMLVAIPALLMAVTAVHADVNTYDFNYVGIGDPSVFGFGSFTTGTPYGDGYVPILSITGFTEAGAITGLETSGGANIDPAIGSLTCCAVGPDFGLGNSNFVYDNAFKPGSPNPFSPNGLLFDVPPAIGPTGYSISPITIMGDNSGNTFEFSYGENGPPYTATPISFTVTAVTPEPAFYGTVALCLGGLLGVYWRRRRNSSV
jgi:hypothetical protein